MPVSLPQPAKPHFLGFTAEQAGELVQTWGWPAYRARQLTEWVYTKLVTDPSAMTNLSRTDREQFARAVEVLPGSVAAHQVSGDGTHKLLLAWPDGSSAETILIPDADRRTACVSSQVGCPVGCRFCASGLNGMRGNLSAGQIVEQVVQLNRLLRDTPGASPADARVTNIVFMGMGEPLANYSNVMQAVRVLHDPLCLNLGARRITISTVGVPARMRQLAEEDLPVNLAISLHAPTEPLRRQLIPWAEHFALDEILDAARYYFERTGREVTLEYILLSDVNDRPDHARQLARLCKSLRANVNLIRYNEVEGLPYRRPLSSDVVAFQQILRTAGVNAHVRRSRGRDIDAACGQLRRRHEQPLTNLASAPPEGM
jgi:23S rRNA (adenine2503-C2)-methyltransferase